MPHLKNHLQIGAIVGCLYGITIGLYNDSDEKWKDALKCGIEGLLGGIIGSVIPDIIEPAKNPNHRNIAHSLSSVGLLSMKFIGNTHSNGNVFLNSLYIGYLSHLIADATTPKRLPLIC